MFCIQSNALTALWVVVFSMALVACKTSYYKKKTDKEVYNIVENIETALFGKSPDFTIETDYSDRAPDEIPSEEIIEDRGHQETFEIGVDQALELAIENSRRYQDEKETLYLTALSLSQNRFAFSPQFLARAGYDITRPPTDPDPSSVVEGPPNPEFLDESEGVQGIDPARDFITGYNLESETVSLGEAQELPEGNGRLNGSLNSRLSVSQALKSGGSITASLTRDLFRFYVGDPRRNVTEAISLNLTQPLLRGFGSRVVAENLKQAERNVIYAIRDFNHFQNQFAVDTVMNYFSLLRGRDIIRNSFADYQSRTNETARLTEQLDAGRVSTVDLGEIQQAELGSRNSYINSIASYGTDLDQFKINLALPVGSDLKLDDEALTEITRQGLPLLDMDAEYAFELALEYSWPLMNSIDQYEDAKRKVYVAANRLKPGIDFFADFSSDDYTKFDSENIRTSMGVELDLPVNRFSERVNYRQTLISFQAALRRLGLALDEKRNTIRRALRNLKQFEQNYQIQKVSMELAAKRVTGASLTYQAGRATVDQIVRAQDNLVSARNALSTTMVNYLGARMNLLLEIGILRTDREQFWISEDAVIVDLASSTDHDVDASEPQLSDPSTLMTPDQLFQ